MRTLRYQADAVWEFKGVDLALVESVNTATLTISGGWAADDEEQPPAPPNQLLVIDIDTTPSDLGQVTEPQDGEGNWALFFILGAGSTQNPVAPPPKFLWYEVTLRTTPGALILRPFVGQVRMLSDLYTPA